MGNEIERIDGRLRTILRNASPDRHEGGNWTLAFDLRHFQLDIRDREQKKVLQFLVRTNTKHIRYSTRSILRGFSSSKAQTWEEQNVVVEVRQGAVTKRWDKRHKPKFGSSSNPHHMIYSMELPKLLYKGETVIMTRSYDAKDLKPSFGVTQSPPTKKLAFDLIKAKTDDESLNCKVCLPYTSEGHYASELARGRMVTNRVTGKKVYALRWASEIVTTGWDYRFEYH